MKKTTFTASLIIKLFAVAASVYAMILSSGGLMKLTYFTNLSNIFADVMLIISLAADIRIYKGKAAGKSNSLYFAKYLSMLSVVLTFFVYMCILAPTSKGGFLAAYFNKGWYSFCLHFVLPVLSVADFFIFDYEFIPKRRYCLYAAIPPLSYVGYVVILANLGVRWGEYEMSAPYNFMNFGAPAGWFGFDLSTGGPDTLGVGAAYMIILLCAIFIGLGALSIHLIGARKSAVGKRSQ